MISTRFIGRLGNSMFQVAACMSYAKKYGYEWAVPFDARESAIHRVYPNLPKTKQGFNGQPKNGYDAAQYEFYEWPRWGDNITLQGFFQSEKFFENVKDQVKQMFQLPHIADYEDFVSIHVRRGDFVKYAKSFPPIGEQYLYDAMGYFSVKSNIRKFLFFSDDIQWCKDFAAKGFQFEVNEGGRHYKVMTEDLTIEFFEDSNEHTSLSVMASCKHHIIANSTFSWWAAYLGHNPDRVIVCPNSRDWYGPENSVVTYAKSRGLEPCRNLIPEGWVQI